MGYKKLEKGGSLGINISIFFYRPIMKKIILLRSLTKCARSLSATVETELVKGVVASDPSNGHHVHEVKQGNHIGVKQSSYG